MPSGSFVAALVFAVIFLAGWRVRLLSQRAALSVGAGATTAYVFVYMLPELSEAGELFVEETTGRALPFPELRVYLAALFGFLLFYGLETLMARSHHQEERRDASTFDRATAIHVAGFAVYVAVVTYTMVHAVTDTSMPLPFYAAAMGLHFLGINRSLAVEEGVPYHRVGRFVLAGAAMFGWGVGALTELSKPAVITAVGFVSGGVVMNSMVMELPGDKDGRFWPFATGAVLYALVLALIR